MDYATTYAEHLAMVDSALQTRQADIIKVQAEMAATAAASAAAAAAAEAAAATLKAQKQADFDALKPLVDKVYFAYTLQHADDATVNAWTQQLLDGVSAETILSGVRSSAASMYVGASASTSVNTAFQTLFGRPPSLIELSKYSAVNPTLIPGVVALEAREGDAETLGLRMQFSQAVKEYYQATNIPLTYGMPMMKAKEQMLTLQAGINAEKLVTDAVSEMGTFLADWGKTINKPGSTDSIPPEKGYFYKDSDTVGVAFYEPPSATGNGKILLTFSEPIDWSAMDKNKDGRLDLFTEIGVVLSNTRVFGDNPTTSTQSAGNSLVINLGANASQPLFSGTDSTGKFSLGDLITVLGVADYQGNTGTVLFAVNVNPALVEPVSTVTVTATDTEAPAAAGIVRVGDRLLITFSEQLNWRNWDLDGNGAIAIDGELKVIASRTGIFGAGASVESYTTKQMTLYLGEGNTYRSTDQIVFRRAMDLAGNVADVLFSEGGVLDIIPPTADSIQVVGNRMFLSFSENINWARMDLNSDGVLALGTELPFSTEPGVLGTTPLVESYGSRNIVLLMSNDKTYRAGNDVILFDLTDFSGNSGPVIFNEPKLSTEIPNPAPTVPFPAVLAGDKVVMTFDRVINWAVLDKNGDGVIDLDWTSTGGAGVNAELTIYVGDGKGNSDSAALGENPTVFSAYSNQLTLQLGPNATYPVATVDDTQKISIVVVGVADLSGYVTNGVFTPPF